jgi:ABC-type polar amino acid transport system ATPase subunit
MSVTKKTEPLDIVWNIGPAGSVVSLTIREVQTVTDTDTGEVYKREVLAREIATSNADGLAEVSAFVGQTVAEVTVRASASEAARAAMQVERDGMAERLAGAMSRIAALESLIPPTDPVSAR